MIQVHIVYAHSTFDQARHLDKTAGHVLCWTGFGLDSEQGPRDGRTATRLKLRQDWNSLVKRRMSKGYAEKNPRTPWGCFISIRTHGHPPPLPSLPKKEINHVFTNQIQLSTPYADACVSKTLPPAFALHSSSQNDPPAGLSTRPRQVKWYCHYFSIYSVFFGIKAYNHLPQGYMHHYEANLGPELLSRILHPRKYDWP
jgi:hypothetical protein